MKRKIVRRHGGEQARGAIEPYEAARTVAAKGHGSVVVVERCLRPVAVVEQGEAAVIGVREAHLACIPLRMHRLAHGVGDVIPMDVRRAERAVRGKCSGEDGGLSPHVFHAESPQCTAPLMTSESPTKMPKTRMPAAVLPRLISSASPYLRCQALMTKKPHTKQMIPIAA